MHTARIVPCRSCGRAITTDNQFCSTCGEPINVVTLDQVRPFRNLVSGVVALASGALLAVGAFLPWQVVRVPGADPERTSIRGWEASDDAMILLGLALLAAVCAAILFSVAERVPLLLVKVGLAVIGVTGLAIALLDIVDVRGYTDPRFTVEVGFGLYLAAVSAVALILISVVTSLQAHAPAPDTDLATAAAQ